jgi:uncharacterized membrane protein YhhN
MLPATPLYLIPALAISVFFMIRAEIVNRRWQFYVLKPISTLLVIAAALMSLLEPSWNRTYTLGILLGLLFSLAGDIALMFQEKRKAFLAGLGFFLAAHIVYAAVFLTLGRFTLWDLLPALILAAVGAGFYILIRPNLGSMKGPVIGYIVVISFMVSRALSTWASPELTSDQAWMIASGALLFYFSDVILAANKFWKPWRYNRISLVFYFSGQFLIALAASYFN